MLQIGSLIAQDLGATKFISPLPNANVVVYQPNNWTLRVKNFGTANVPVGDTIMVYVFFYSGGAWVNPQAVGGSILTSPFNTNDSMQLTTSINFTIGAGLRAVGFAYIWLGHVPGTVKVFGANFNFVTSAGIAEITNIDRIYYANGELNVAMRFNHDNDARLIVSNLNGQQLWNNNISNKANDNSPLSISLGDLPKGIYIVNLISSGSNIAKKFIVQ